jgi:ATP-dependent Clp protease protease subunit
MKTKPREVVLRGVIDQANAQDVYAQMLYLKHLDQTTPISLLIDSSGGIVDDCLALYDLVRKLKMPVQTHCTGKAEGGAVLIVAAGTKGFRSARQSSTFTLVPSFDVRSPLDSKELVLTDVVLIRELAEVTGQSQTTLMQLVLRSATLSAVEAQHLGIIDRVVP